MSDDEAAIEFSRRLRHLMRVRGLTPKALCWAMGWTPDRVQTVRTWMNGDAKPGYESMVRLHRALGCEWRELYGE